jgi:Mn2+/Fe2+ NRAMP family transporter
VSLQNTESKTFEVPEPTGVYAQPWSFKKAMGLMAAFGPAAIVASVSIGAGETIVVVRLGSWAGYGLLWLVLLSVLVKGIFVTYMLGRYTAVSGEYIGHRLIHVPGPRGWILITIILCELIGAPLAWVAIAKPCGTLFSFIFEDYLSTVIDKETWENVITTAFIALALLVGLGISYSRLERQQIVICCILVTGTIIGTMMVKPDFWQTVVGTLSLGHIPEPPEWALDSTKKSTLLNLCTSFAYVGGSVMGYVVYANWVGLHRWGMTGHADIERIRQEAFASDKIDYLPESPAQVSRMRRLVAPLRWDVGMGALVLFIVTGAFMLSGAAVLYPALESGELPAAFKNWSLLTDQAEVWKEIHRGLVPVYYVCIIVALWGTLQALPEIYTRVSQEFLQAIWVEREWDYKRLRLIISGYLLITTLIVTWSGLDFDTLTSIAGFILSNFSIALVMLAALYLNFSLPRAYRTGRFVFVGSVISAAILVVVASINGWTLAQSLFN